MAKTDYDNNQNFVLNLINDAIVTHSNTVEIIESGQMLTAGRSWIVRKRANLHPDSAA